MNQLTPQPSKIFRSFKQFFLIGVIGTFFFQMSVSWVRAENNVYNIYIIGESSNSSSVRLTSALTQFEYMRNGGVDLSQSGFKLQYTDADHVAEATVHIRYLDKNQMRDHAAVVAMPSGAALPYIVWFKNGQQEYAHAGIEGDTSSAIIRWFVSFTRDTYLLPRPEGREFFRPVPLSTTQVEEFVDERTHRTLYMPASQMSAVALIGAAHSPTSNLYLNSLRLSEIKNFLSRERQISEDYIFALAGSREGNFLNADTTLSVGGIPTRTSISSLNPSGSFTKSNLRSLMQSLGSVPNRNLLMFASGPENLGGLAAWTGSENNKVTVTPADIRVAMGRARFRSTVLFAGNSYGGTFAESVSCGFFAAHPGFPAIHFAEPLVHSENVQAGTISSDYLKQIEVRAREADFTFRELHEYAFLNTDMRDVPYSSYDHLVDQFFRGSNAANAAQMPDYLSLRQLNELLQSNVGSFETDFIYDQLRNPSNAFHKILQKSPLLTRVKRASHLFHIDHFYLTQAPQSQPRDVAADLRRHFPAGMTLWQYPSEKGLMYLTHLDAEDLERVIAQFYAGKSSNEFTVQCNLRSFFDGSVLDTSTSQRANGHDVTQYSCFLFEGRKSVGVIHLSTNDTWHKNYAHYSTNALVERQWSDAYLNRSLIARAQMMVRRHYFNRHMIHLSGQSSSSSLVRRWRNVQACENQTMSTFLSHGESATHQNSQPNNSQSSAGGM